ncbi:hypothetical protein ACGCUQ_03260 [Eubacteriales bacterium KG127]
MDLMIENKRGEIVVDKDVFAQKIILVLCQLRWRGKFWLVNSKNKIIVENGHYDFQVFSDSLILDENKNGITVELPIIVEFGIPLRYTIGDLIDEIYHEFSIMSRPVSKITINIVGVKSKLVASRDLKFSKSFIPKGKLKILERDDNG